MRLKSSFYGLERLFLSLPLLLLLIACSSEIEVNDKSTNIPFTTTYPTVTEISIEVGTEEPVISLDKKVQMDSLTPTTTALPTKEMKQFTGELASIGTLLPTDAPLIDSSNVDNLAPAARWGRGAILGVAYSPDGRFFVVGSPYGLAIYDQEELDDSAKWLGFKNPIDYRNIYFSLDGNFVNLEGYENDTVLAFPNGGLINSKLSRDWAYHSEISEWGRFSVFSPSGRYRLDTKTTYDEEYMEKEYSLREIIDVATEEIVSVIHDETIQITYDIRHEPEGCDLSSFSYCGNVYAPSASLPYKALFSTSDRALGILYRPPNLWNSSRYGSLRIYSVQEGKLLQMFGSLSMPIEDFSFSPDGDYLLIAYVDGTVQVITIDEWNIKYSSRDFSSVNGHLSFAANYNLLFIESSISLEVRSLLDGSLVGRYESPAFALNTPNALFASADSDGNIRLINLANGSTLWSVKGHEGNVLSLSLSQNGKYLVSAGEDCKIKLWDAELGEFLHFFERTIVNAYGEPGTDSRIFLYFFHFIPQKDQLIGYGSWGTVVSWSVNSGAVQYVIYPESLEYYMGMKTLNPHFPDSFGIDDENGEIFINDRIYDLGTGEKVGVNKLPDTLPPGCAPPGLKTDNSMIFTPGYDSRLGGICVLSTENLELIDEIKIFPDTSDLASVNWAYLAPDQRNLFVTTFYGPILIFQVRD
jgi:WD40 repeat protein